MFERWRNDFHEDEYRKGQEAVAADVAAREALARQARLKEIGVVAAETINQANELAADGDPHKRQLAELIKNAAIGVVKQTEAGHLPAGGGRLDELDPFSSSSDGSGTSLPSSKSKALPVEPPKPKRGRGRPRKNP